MTRIEEVLELAKKIVMLETGLAALHKKMAELVEPGRTPVREMKEEVKKPKSKKPKASRKVTDYQQKRTSLLLSDAKDRVRVMLERNGPMSTTNLHRVAGGGSWQIFRRALKELQDEDVVKSSGAGRFGQPIIWSLVAFPKAPEPAQEPTRILQVVVPE